MKSKKASYVMVTLLFLHLFVISSCSAGKPGLKKEGIESPDQPPINNWLCYYGSDFGPEVYSKFDLVVLDGRNHPELKHIRPGKPLILGYVTVGEVDITSDFWPLAKGKDFIVKKNDFWNSWIVDVRAKEWQDILFNIAFEDLFEKKFDGVFLDTFDSSISLETGSYKDKFAGTGKALGDIVKKLRKKYPNKLIAVNRGLPVLPDIAEYIDYILIEDMYSYYSEEKGYIRVDKATKDILLRQVEKGLEVNPGLTVLTLDYASPQQTDIVKEAIEYSRKRGFVSYVSTYELNQIFFYTLDN